MKTKNERKTTNGDYFVTSFKNWLNFFSISGFETSRRFRVDSQGHVTTVEWGQRKNQFPGRCRNGRIKNVSKKLKFSEVLFFLPCVVLVQNPECRFAKKIWRKIFLTKHYPRLCHMNKRDKCEILCHRHSGKMQIWHSGPSAPT